MPSETDLINDSLGQIGAAAIIAIDDGTVNANHALRFYPTLRDAELAITDWTFARRRVVLAQDATAPVFEFAFQYTLPADFLVLREYNGAAPSTGTGTDLVLLEAKRLGRYKIEGRKLLSNDGEAQIVYTACLTDPNIWSTYFYQGLAAKLAGKFASAITKDRQMAKSKLEEGIAWMELAAAIDGQQDSLVPFQVLDLIRGR